MLSKTFKEKKPKNKWITIKINYWKPEIGDKIEGRLVQVTDNGKEKIYVIEQSDKKRVKIWGKTYLDQLMDEIEINDYIRITYNGIKETKNKRQMKQYNVERRIEDED